MKNTRKLTVVVFVTLLSLVLPHFMSAVPAEAGRGNALYWKQKRAKQAAEDRLSRTHSKAHNRRFDPATQSLRMRMFAGKTLSAKQLKFLADKGEGLAAVRYAQSLQSNGGPPGTIVTYFAKAAAQGRKDAIKPLLALLRIPDTALSTADLRKAESGLLVSIKRGNADAMTGLAQLYLAGFPFGTDDNKAVELLVMAATHGDVAAAVQAGLMLEASGDTSGDRSRAAEMFKIAAEKGNIVALAKLEALAPVN